MQKRKTTLTFSPPWHSTQRLTVNLEDPGRNLFKIQAPPQKKVPSCLQNPQTCIYFSPAKKPPKNAHVALQAPQGQPFLPCWLAASRASTHPCMWGPAAASPSIKLASTHIAKRPVLALQGQGILFILSRCQAGFPRSLKATPT